MSKSLLEIIHSASFGYMEICVGDCGFVGWSVEVLKNLYLIDLVEIFGYEWLHISKTSINLQLIIKH